MKNRINVHGFSFNEGTNEKVMQVLETANKDRRRIRVWYGDVLTGKSWNEENMVCGYVGKSTGINKIPLLIHSSSCYGGSGLLADCIIKIVDTQSKKVYYQHENFNQPTFVAFGGNTLSMEHDGYVARVMHDSELYANCKTLTSARRLSDFMNGKRMCK